MTEQSNKVDTPPNFGALTEEAKQFLAVLSRLQFSPCQIFGVFFMVGAQTVLNYSQADLERHRNVSAILGPHDHNVELDVQVGDYFCSQEHLLEELIYWIGFDFEYRAIEIEGLPPRQLFTPSKHGLLRGIEKRPEKLTDIHHLYMTLFETLGQNICREDIGLREAYMSGLFQSQMLMMIDQKPMVQLLRGIQQLMSPILGIINSSALDARPGSIDNFLDDQLALMGLWPCRSDELFMSVAWPFQSWIFFKDGVEISGLEQLSPADFWDHCWETGSRLFQNEIHNIPKLSDTTIAINALPPWGSSELNYGNIDGLIESWAGCGSNSLEHYTDKLHNRAFMIHCVYCSIAKAKEE